MESFRARSVYLVFLILSCQHPERKASLKEDDSASVDAAVVEYAENGDRFAVVMTTSLAQTLDENQDSLTFRSTIAYGVGEKKENFQWFMFAPQRWIWLATNPQEMQRSDTGTANCAATLDELSAQIEASKARPTESDVVFNSLTMLPDVTFCPATAKISRISRFPMRGIITFKSNDDHGETYRVLLESKFQVATAALHLNFRSDKLSQDATSVHKSFFYGITQPGTQVNTGYDWHIPFGYFTDRLHEFCDGRPSYVGDVLTVGQDFCPWNMYVLEIDRAD